MKILHTCARFPPYIGGTEQAVFGICRGLKNLGHDVRVLCADLPPVGSGNFQGIFVERLPFWMNLSNSPIIPGLFRRISQKKAQIIHTYLPHPWVADISRIASRKLQVPLYLTYVNDIIGKGKYHFIARLYNLLMLPPLLKSARKIFVAHAEYISRSSILSAWKSKIVVAQYGVDTSIFRPLPVAKNSVFTLFFLSVLDQFHSYKGLDFLLEAVKDAVKTENLQLIIGGAGVLEAHYKEMARALGLSSSVKFSGKLSQDDVLKNYNQCDAFILPSTSSLREGFGLVAQEAMACGTPVIVSEVVGVARDVEEVSAGLLTPPENASALSAAIQTLCRNRDRAREMGQRGLALVKTRYSLETHARILEKEYQNR